MPNKWKLNDWEPWKKYKDNFSNNPLDGWMRISSYLIGPIITFIGWLVDYLKWGILLAIVLTLAILVWRHQRTTGSLESPKKHNWIGIIVLVLFGFIILALFIPFTGNKIENLYFHTITPTFTATIITPTNTPEPPPTFTPPPTNTPLPTFTPLPTSTPTITPTLTPTVTPTFPSEEFSNSCIPNVWKLYPTYLMDSWRITPAPCPTLLPLGYAGLNPGLQIAFKPTNESNFIGIYRNLPLGNFELQTTISRLNLSPENGSVASFYIMFFDSADASGYSDKSKLVNSFKFSVDIPNSNPVLYFEKTPYAYSLEPSDNIGIICNKNSQLVTCIITGLSPNPVLPEITFKNNWDSIFIGYYVDPNSLVRLDITHFQIIPK